MERLRITVSGTVQGVGFRPYVYGLARSLGLKGFVTNTSGGVTIEVEGDAAASFVERLAREAPPLAVISAVDIRPMEPIGYPEFRIVESSEAGGFTLVCPDVSVCDDCLSEMLDPNDRRYRYPFINCTNCGPRYSITKAVPYDRPNTTMAAFRMCPECEREYGDPTDRRFHAQPDACPACGPRVEFVGEGEGDGKENPPDPIETTIEILRDGGIAAIKGLGGFHLACDALNPGAVEKLRHRKRKNRKPFALMARDMEVVKRYCEVSEVEEALLLSPRRPIALLAKKDAAARLPEAIAPGGRLLGFMLPYTPLHRLIMEGVEVAVMTSGNLSEEPIQTDNEGARSKLGQMADAFLTHNRDIFMRVDDSVLRVTDKVRVVRRARGFTPEPIGLGADGPDVLAAGADIKNAFALFKGPFAIMSQHIGDMENYETLEFFEETLANLKAVYRAEPVAVAYDLHPGYMSTGWALRQRAKRLGVQHHHAHIASVMAEKRLSGKVIGVAFDGSGYGTDGTLWGGEFLLADAAGFRRAGHLRAMPLPGAERAVREPWRTAVSYVLGSFGHEAHGVLGRLGFFDLYGTKKVEDVMRVAGVPEASPPSSGAGRLFDAVSALLGICGVSTFEGEAAIALEAAAAEGVGGSYPVDVILKDDMEVDFGFALVGMINDLLSGRPREVIASMFQNSVTEATVRVALRLSQQNGIGQVVLGGGVFQNEHVLRGVKDGLSAEGLEVYTNELVPMNDGGIALGQGHVLRERLRMGLPLEDGRDG